MASEPLTVRISLLTKVKGHLFWLILLPLLLGRENRKARALWILLPYYAWLGLLSVANAGDYIGAITGVLLPLVTLVPVLLLLGARLQKRNGWGVLLGTILIAAAVHGIWIWSGPFETELFFTIASAVLTLLVLLAFLLARLFCRFRYGGWRLALGLLGAVLLLAVLLLVVMVSVMFRQFGDSGMSSGLGEMMLEGLIPFLLAGAVVYLVLLSLLAVPLATEFYRARLCGLLKLKRPAPAGG